MPPGITIHPAADFWLFVRRRSIDDGIAGSVPAFMTARNGGLVHLFTNPYTYVGQAATSSGAAGVSRARSCVKSCRVKVHSKGRATRS